jgi:Family of unknown function (DUF6062)
MAPAHRSGSSGRSGSPGSDLPARSISDVKLAELLDGSGCPLCLGAARSAAANIHAFLYESVVDVRFRAELDRSRGFCQAHARQVLEANRSGSGGALGASILFGAVLAIRAREVEALIGGRGRDRQKRAADAARPAACPVCRVSADAVAGAAEGFHRLGSDEAWRDALARAPFCLDHLVLVLARRPAGPGWEAIEGAQSARIADVRARLERFAKHSSHDRRHHMTDEERRAPDDAAAMLGGSPGDHSPPGT